MAVYLDTSALVKLYAEEEKREIVFEAVDSLEAVEAVLAFTEELKLILNIGSGKTRSVIKVLGWAPKTDFHEGLERTLRCI